MLIPSRTDTRHWHDYIFNKATDIVIVYTGACRIYQDEED